MASNDKTTAVNPPPPAVKGPSLADVQARDQFIAVGLREMIRYHLENGNDKTKMNFAMAGTLAVRYANAVMAARAAETAPLQLTSGTGTVTEAPLPPPIADAAPQEPAKSIAEIIGEAPPLEELKA